MQRCEKMTRDFYPVASDSDADKVYEVRLWTPGEFPSCTCVAFKIKRNKIANELGGGGKGAGKGLANELTVFCKHLTYVEKTVCHWEQKTDADFRFDGTCPNCGGPVVDGNGVTAAPSDDAALADLLALREELASKPVAVPSPTTVPEDNHVPGPNLSVADAAAALIKEMT